MRYVFELSGKVNLSGSENLMFLLFLKAGEVILILLAILAMMTALLALPGALIYIVVKGRKNRQAWADIAEKLGLRLRSNGKLPMRGDYNGCPVEVNLLLEKRMGGYSGEIYHRRYINYTYCRTEFPHNLRLLLDIGPGRAGRIRTGLAGFDREFAVSGYDPEVIRSLLTGEYPTSRTENLAGDLLLAKQRLPSVRIDDEGVYVKKKGVVTDFATIKEWLDLTTYLAKRFYAARRNLPPAAWEIQTARAWRLLAEKNGLTFEQNDLTLEGFYQSFPVRVSLQTGADKWQTRIRLGFSRPLAVGLQIMPDNALHKTLSLFGLQDIKSGHQAFDDAFIVKAENESLARQKLRPELCDHLLKLKSRASRLLIDDEQITVVFDTVLGDERHLQSYLDALVLTATMLLR